MRTRWGAGAVGRACPVVALAVVTPRRVIADRLVLAALERSRGDARHAGRRCGGCPDSFCAFPSESVVFQRCYTTVTDPDRALADLWGARREVVEPPFGPGRALARHLRARRVARSPRRSALLMTNAWGSSDAAGFDVIRRLPIDGYARPMTTAAVAVDLEQRGTGPSGHLTFVFLGHAPRLSGPARFWGFLAAGWRTLAGDGGARLHRSLLGGLWSAAFRSRASDGGGLLWGRIGGVPVRHVRSGPWSGFGRTAEGRPLRESKSGLCSRCRATCCRRPSRSIPVLLGRINVSTVMVCPACPATCAGTAVPAFATAARRDDAGTRVVIRGDAAKALIVDGRYKYIRRRSGRRAGQILRRGVAEDFDPEELF